MAKTILIVEDDPNISELVQMYLEKEGYNTRIASDGGQGLDLFRQLRPDLVLLDIMLPVMDGWSVLRTIRQDSKTPVIMLTAKGETNDKVQGLKQGADDYLTKPFGVMELVSCVKAVLRRCARPSHVLHLSGLTLDQDAHTVSCDGQRVLLTYKEYELLRLFLSHPGMAFTRDQLMAQVWGTDYYGETRTVDMHIRTLRQKLGPYGGLIQTVRNVGYRLEEQG